MAGISLQGLGSGLDTEAMVSSLVKANSSTLTSIQNRAAQLRDAVSTMTGIGSSLSSLSAAAFALSSPTAAASVSASSSGPAVVASAFGNAKPGSYEITVSSLAKEQRTYSARLDSATDALGQSGSFTIAAGTGDPTTINVDSTDTLDDIVSKINTSGLRVSASTIYDGTKYRLQVRGLDTGAANTLTFDESGTDFDFNGARTLDDGVTKDPSGGSTRAATDAVFKVDDIEMTRPTNQIAGAIPGVTMALTQKTTTDPITVKVDTDSTALNTKLSAIVTAYNSAVTGIQKAAGYGSTPASNASLAGDSSLRSISSRLSQSLAKQVGTGKYQSLASIGLHSTQDGSLTLDSDKLTAALTDDPSGVKLLLGGTADGSTSGIMSSIKDMVDSFTQSTTGLLSSHQASFTNQAKKLDTDATSESTRLSRYETSLRTAFANMETSISQSKALGSSISRIG